jgi:predicted dienelactone hydrolase
VRVSVPATKPFDVLVWYPSQEEEVPWRVGPFPIAASHNGSVANGAFPIVLLSHGGGPGGGSPLVLREISIYLARHGFIVIEPFHGPTPLPDRVIQIKAALDAVSMDSRFTAHVAPAKLGMLGYSLGGAVALSTAGGVPSIQNLVAYCATHSEDARSCGPGPDGKKDTVPPGALPHLPLRALVLLDPLGVPFDRDGLSTVNIPVLLFRPKQSDEGEENTLVIAKGLPRAPKIEYISGGHSVLIDVCPPALKTDAPEVCVDPTGVDRAAIHAIINEQIANFFHDNL